MKFLQVREMRTNYGKVMEQLRKEKRIVLTSKGKPVALLTEMTEDNFEDEIAGTKKGAHASEASAIYAAEDPEILRVWIEEAERRRQEYLDGKTKLISAKKVFGDLRKKNK
jgi:antitoxin (DNA-binding transcriptional repressor) of toxin-antitoxin stability system